MVKNLKTEKQIYVVQTKQMNSDTHEVTYEDKKEFTDIHEATEYCKTIPLFWRLIHRTITDDVISIYGGK